MKFKRKRILLVILALIMCLMIPMHIFAQTRAYDTVNVQHSKTFSYSKRYISMGPDLGDDGLESSFKTVSFKIKLSGGMQYDRISGAYVSASTPTATLVYEGPVNLGLYNVTTSKYDNGSSITFSFSADVKGQVYDRLVTINYGRITDSFTVSK